MEYLIGAGLALTVGVCATLTGFDRDRAFYATVLLVVAAYYDLFAAMGRSPEAFALEALALLGFAAVAVVGFKTNLWIVAGGLFGHGMFDLVHGHVISNPGVPLWWPMFCMTYDIMAAGYLGWLLLRPGKAGLPARRAAISAPFAEAS